MDENKIQQRRRDQEEAAAEKRAEILGLNYRTNVCRFFGSFRSWG